MGPVFLPDGSHCWSSSPHPSFLWQSPVPVLLLQCPGLLLYLLGCCLFFLTGFPVIARISCSVTMLRTSTWGGDEGTCKPGYISKLLVTQWDLSKRRKKTMRPLVQQTSLLRAGEQSVIELWSASLCALHPLFSDETTELPVWFLKGVGALSCVCWVVHRSVSFPPCCLFPESWSQRQGHPSAGRWQLFSGTIPRTCWHSSVWWLLKWLLNKWRESVC